MTAAERYSPEIDGKKQKKKGDCHVSCKAIRIFHEKVEELRHEEIREMWIFDPHIVTMRYVMKPLGEVIWK